MVRAALLGLVALLEFTVAAPPKQDVAHRPNFSLVTSNQESGNSSLVEDFLDQPIFEIPAIVQKPAAGIQPIQWPMPEVFKRQAACSNYCGPSQSAPRTYCGCGQQCCGTGCCATASGQVCCAGGSGCCNTAAGAVCCGTRCCTNGATCNGSKECEFRTTVITRVATSTTWFYRDVTTTVSANGGTATITSTFRSVAVVTVSTADVATVIATATVTPGAAKRARDLHDIRPAPTSGIPQQTRSPPPRLHASKAQVGHEQEILAPQITQSPLALQHVAKRQVNNFVSTVTSVVSTITVSSTSTRLVTTTVAARATATYSTTIWSTVTNFVNAKSSTTITTTLVLTPGVSVVNVVTVTDGSGGGNNNGGGSNGDNNGGNGEKGNDQGGSSNTSNSKSLSTGAKAGIGAGTAGGSLVICIILGFIFWRRRKSREEKNREMIDNAVTSAMAAQAQRQSDIQPGRTYYDGKHISTTTSTVSPHPYSPSPEVLSPQPQYVYPPPPGHAHLQQQGQMYNNANAGPMGFPESGMEQQQYRYSAQGYGGSEIEGNPVQRYELAQFSSPPPQQAVPHPGPYTQTGGQEMDVGQGHVQGRPVYSDLPEVQRSDLPEVRR